MSEKVTEQFLYELWYSIAETIFDRVCKVTELNEEQIEALREVALRPNDFQVFIDENS
jgi:tyrosyl-tRNA synthetase